MPLFQYKIENSRGEIIGNSIEATSREELASSLKTEGNKVLSIKPLEIRKVSIFTKKVSLIEKANLFRFLSTMIRAGLSVAEGIDVIREETQSTRLKDILSDLSYETRRGNSITSLLAKYKDDFDPVILAIVRVGEESGTLDESFDYLSDQLTSQYEINQKIKGSFAYPAVIMSAMLGEGLLMAVWVLPQIASSFMKMNFELPLFTRLIMNVGMIIGSHKILFISVVASTLITGFILSMLKPVKNGLINLFTKIGPIKKVLNQIDVARYARTFSALSKRGVPIVEALNITADTLTTPSFREAASKFGEEVAKGSLLSDAMMKNRKIFPPAMIQTIKAGEKTGMLDKVLLELANFYEGEVERDLKRLTTMLEPIMILAIGVAVGVMVVMLIYPIYNVIGSLQSSIQK